MKVPFSRAFGEIPPTVKDRMEGEAPIVRVTSMHPVERPKRGLRLPPTDEDELLAALQQAPSHNPPDGVAKDGKPTWKRDK